MPNLSVPRSRRRDSSGEKLALARVVGDYARSGEEHHGLSDSCRLGQGDLNSAGVLPWPVWSRPISPGGASPWCAKR